MASLLRGGCKWDARLEAAIEVGVVLSALLCIQGAIWAKPTWGVWWDWDPRLTTTAVLRLRLLRASWPCAASWTIPVRRAVWSAVATIIAYVDVPIVYFSVQVVELAAPDAVDAGDGLARRSTGRCASTPSASSS